MDNGFKDSPSFNDCIVVGPKGDITIGHVKQIDLHMANLVLQPTKQGKYKVVKDRENCAKGLLTAAQALKRASDLSKSIIAAKSDVWTVTRDAFAATLTSLVDDMSMFDCVLDDVCEEKQIKKSLINVDLLTKERIMNDKVVIAAFDFIISSVKTMIRTEVHNVIDYECRENERS